MTQMQIEQLTEEEYNFFLSYGVVNDNQLQLIELIDSLLHE